LAVTSTVIVGSFELAAAVGKAPVISEVSQRGDSCFKVLNALFLTGADYQARKLPCC